MCADERTPRGSARFDLDGLETDYRARVGQERNCRVTLCSRLCYTLSTPSAYSEASVLEAMITRIDQYHATVHEDD